MAVITTSTGNETPLLAIVGMGCRAPQTENVDELWKWTLEGKYAVTRVPEKRYDRKTFYDPKKGVKGKSYMNYGGLIDYTAFDPRECRFPARLMTKCDIGSLEMCRVAAAACRDAGINPFRVSYPNTGVYLGSTVVGVHGHESVYATMCPELAALLHEIPALNSLEAAKRLSVHELAQAAVDHIRNHGTYPSKRGHTGPFVQSIPLAVTESLELTGPSILLDAACSSALNALAMARRDLLSGHIDMAIIGGGTFFSQENLVLFSNAQSGSPDGSFPFSDRANGVICSEAYAALIVKTLPRALADGDRIHAVVHGIGLSSDGKGRSHWAPRVEGQIEAIRRAYADPEDLRRLAYYEAHSTSTPLGDRTELDAIQTVFGDAFPKKRPIGSFKGNFGHPLESAGGLGLIKAIQILKHNMIPPQCGAFPLSKDFEWDRLPFYVPEQAEELPPSPDGRPRLAAVSAFGVGGINAHVVIEEPTALSTSSVSVRTGFSTSEKENVPKKNGPIAVIGAGAVFPGARTLQAMEDLIRFGIDPKRNVPENRWNPDVYAESREEGTELDPWKAGVSRGGFVTDFEYDWKRHKIPPKQVVNGNPLQYMILDAADRALDDAGYEGAGSEGKEASKKLDPKRTSVFVGSPLGNDFLIDLTLSFRMFPFQNLVSDLLRERGVDDPEIIEKVGKEFVDVFFRHNTALLDETGGFTASSLASRITKTYDLLGGCVTLDAGSASSLAALAQAMRALQENECDTVLCASGSRNMFPGVFLERERLGNLTPDDPLPSEGAGVLVLKRLEDAERDGDTIRCVLHGFGTGFDADAEIAFEKAIRQAWDSSDFSEPTLSAVDRVELSSASHGPREGEIRASKRFYPKAELVNLADQLGDTQGVSGMASLFRASMTETNPKENRSPLGAVSAWDQSGIAWHLVLERSPVATTKSDTKIQVASAGAVSTGKKYEIVRFGAASTEKLRETLASVSRLAAEDRRPEIFRDNKFEAADRSRIAFVTDGPDVFAEQLSYALEQLGKPHDAKLLARKNIFLGSADPAKRGKIAFLCSGQGSQYEGMLRGIVDHSSEAKAVLAEIDVALEKAGAPPFAELAWSGSPKLGTDVKRTQLSIFAADMLLYRSAEQMGIRPEIVAGHSYGEFPALTVSGGWSLEQGALATAARCDAITGCKNAVGKLLVAQMNEAESTAFCREMGDSGIDLYVANLNAPKQTVFGATETGAGRAVALLQKRKVSAKILEVPRPFHTPIMSEVRDPLFKALARIPIRKPVKRFFSSVSNEFETDPENIHRNLADQMTVPVRYVALIDRLLDEGCTALIECGPGNVLTGIHQKILAGRPNGDSIPCLGLDAKDRNDSLSLFVARATLEVNGHLDASNEKKQTFMLQVDPDLCYSQDIRSAHTESFFERGARNAAAIRRALRRRADFAGTDLSPSISILPPETIPPFIVEMAHGAGVLAEPLYAYWKTTPDDKIVFPEKTEPAEESSVAHDPKEVETPVPANVPDTLRFDEYVGILRRYQEIPDENARRHATRFVTRLVDTPMPKNGELSLPVAGRVLILGDSPLGTALDEELRKRGCETIVVRIEGTPDEIQTRISDICSKTPTPHCFYALNREDWDECHRVETGDELRPERWRELRDRQVLRPFAAVQGWYGELAKRKDLFAKGSFYAATFLGGDGGFSGSTDLRGGAPCGMAKSVFLESGLTTQNTFRSLAVDFSNDLDARRCAEFLLEEWAYGPPTGEISYTGDRRRMIFNVPDFLEGASGETSFTHKKVLPPGGDLRPHGNWIVTGGARGVTAYTARELAKQYGVKLHLLGSSPVPEVPGEWLGLDENGKKELQKSVMVEARKEGRNPVAEWSRIDRTIDLAESLKLFEKDGISYVYHLCDVTDREKLTETLETIRQADGPITGILHGAGIDVSSAFQKKTAANVEKTYAVKTDGAVALMHLTRQDPVKHFIAFGSSSGRLGSYGQADYSTANDVLAKLVRRFSVLRPDCFSYCFDWGPWDEIGMAMRPESKNSIAVREYMKIPPVEALRFLNEEIGYGVREHEMLFCDWKALLKWFVPICEALPENFSKAFAENNPDTTPDELLKGAFGKQDIKPEVKSKPASHALDSTPLAPPPHLNKEKSIPALEERKMKRMLLRMIPQERGAEETPFPLVGKAVIYGDNADARALAEKLSQRSVPYVLLPESEDEDAMEAYVRKEFADDPPLHVFFMSCRNPAGLREATQLDRPDSLNHWLGRRQVSMDVPAVLLREWLKILHKKKLTGRASVAAALSLGGNYAIDDSRGTGPVALEGTLLGAYLKGLYHESGGPKREGLTIRVLDAPIDEAPETVAEILLTELGSGSRGDRLGIESAVVGGRLFMPRLIDSEFSEQDQSTLPPITRGGTWIVTGGARGITAETVKLLAPFYGLKVHLIGTLPAPKIDESLRYLSDEQLEPYKQKLVKEALQQKQLPDKVWEAFRRELEVDRNLRRMHEAGIDATYHQCDVTDHVRLKETVETIRRQHGPIRGVIQGACNSGNASMARNATPIHVRSGKRVIEIKMDATLALLELLKDDPLEVFIAYGSVSGRFGAGSVSAYCSGNDGLCKMMRVLRRAKPRCRAIGFHWHAWDEVGMTMRPISYGSTKVLKMTLLSPKEGTLRILEELEKGGGETEIVVSDDQYYSQSFSSEMRFSGDGGSKPEHPPLVDKIVREPGDTRLETVWNPRTEPLLIEHRLTGKPILPAVLMVESMLEAARVFEPPADGTNVGNTAFCIRDFQIAEGLRFFTDTPQTMRTHVEPSENGCRCRLMSAFANTKGVVLNPNRLHAEAEIFRVPYRYDSSGIVLPDEWQKPLEEARRFGEPQKTWPIQYLPPESVMYHGPVFQELQWIGIEGDLVWGESVTQPTDRWTGSRGSEGWIIRPASLDACLYLCAAATWYFFKCSTSLPKNAGRLLMVRPPKEGERCRLVARRTYYTETVIRYDFFQLGEDGTPVCMALDYCCQLHLSSTKGLFDSHLNTKTEKTS